jgi:hypothetical protein
MPSIARWYTRSRSATRSRALVSTVALVLLGACGDDEPTAVAATAPATEFRRLVVSDTAPFARIFDAATGARVDSMGGLPSRITYLYTAKGRIAFAHFQTRNQVSFIDGGVFEQNGRGAKQAPRIIGSFADQTPIHGNYNGDMVSVHFDGSGNVRFWSEQGVAAGNTQPVLTVRTGNAHHGAGMATFDGGFVSASIQDPANPVLPNGVVVYNRQGAELARNTSCPGLHGLAGNNAGKLYGCADGALFVSISGNAPAFAKFTHASDPRFGVGTVWARDGQSNFLVRMSIRGQPVSAATRTLGVAQVSTRSMLPISLPGSDLDWTAELDYTGRHALVLGRTGNLYVVDMATRQVTGTIAGLVPPMPTSGTVLTPFFTFAEGVAYVTSPIQGRVYEITIAANGVASITRTMNVGGTPERIVVLGVRENRTLQR